MSTRRTLVVSSVCIVSLVLTATLQAQSLATPLTNAELASKITSLEQEITRLQGLSSCLPLPADPVVPQSPSTKAAPQERLVAASPQSPLIAAAAAAEKRRAAFEESPEGKRRAAEAMEAAEKKAVLDQAAAEKLAIAGKAEAKEVAQDRIAANRLAVSDAAAAKTDAAAAKLVAQRAVAEAAARRKPGDAAAQFSPWDGSHRGLTRVIKKSMNDPASYEHVRTSYIDMGDYLSVTTTFRGKNAFGAVVLTTVLAVVNFNGTAVIVPQER